MRAVNGGRSISCLLKIPRTLADYWLMLVCRGLGLGLLTATLAGCAGPPRASPVGFVNETRHPDAYLWTKWRTAQRKIASQVELNPLQQSTENAPPVVLAGDARALSVLPRRLKVGPSPDVSSLAFLAATGTFRPDPTGMIACPQPCDVRYTPAYSRYRPELTRYATSWESADANFDTILEYEFENQILFALGYDMRRR